MARRRMIDPGIWSDPTIGELTIPARLLFLGMVSLADDEGRIDLNVRYLRKEIFGYDDLTVADVAALLDEIITQCKNLQSYWADNRHYGIFLTWTRYQKIDRAYRSRLPDPPAYEPAEGLIEWSENIHRVKARASRTFDEHSTHDRRTVHERSMTDPGLKELNLTEPNLTERNRMEPNAHAGAGAVKSEPAAAGGSNQNGTKEPEEMRIPDDLMAMARAAGRKKR
jgi:hypothetical protein